MGPPFGGAFNPNGEHRFSIRGRGVPLLLTQRRTTMSSNTSRHVVCRLLGGSGRPQLKVVPTRKLPVLCMPFRQIPAEAIALPLSLPLAA